LLIFLSATYYWRWRHTYVKGTSYDICIMTHLILYTFSFGAL
jgi:hypothetical protein